MLLLVSLLLPDSSFGSTRIHLEANSDDVPEHIISQMQSRILLCKYVSNFLPGN